MTGLVFLSQVAQDDLRSLGYRDGSWIIDALLPWYPRYDVLAWMVDAQMHVPLV